MTAPGEPGGDTGPAYRPRRVPRSEMLTLRGLRTHLTRWGPPGDPPLVFLHGFLDTSDTFQFLVDALSRDWPIVAPDWRGFGRSEWNGHAYWFPDYLADLDQLLEVLSPAAPVTLVGHSMGGYIATLYAGVRPERVDAVISLEGFGLPRKEPSMAPARYAKWLAEERHQSDFRTYPSLGAFAEQLRRRTPRLSAGQALFLAGATTRRVDGGVRSSADPAHRRVNPTLYRHEEVEACWAACRAPVLIVQGARSDLLAAVGAAASPAALAQHFRQLSVESLPEAGHMLHQEEPQACAALIEAFLENLPPRAGAGTSPPA